MKIFFIFIILIISIRCHSENLRSLLQWSKNTKKYFHAHDKENSFFKNIHSITNSGTNAEAYWSFDGKNLSFQAIRGSLADTHSCDQIYTMSSEGLDIKLISPSSGRTTCSYFYPDGQHLIFSMTTDQIMCPPSPDMNFGYVWPIYKDMDIFIKNLPFLL